MFIIGTGRVRADVPPMYRYKGWLVKSAAAFAIANDTPKIAFAPKRDLLFVPSNSIIASSSSTCSRASAPTSASAISPFTNSTACNTPFPRYRVLSPSLNSTASCAPVDAPDGTAALPSVPSSRITSTSTVGFPRLSNISRANISIIVLIDVFPYLPI